MCGLFLFVLAFGLDQRQQDEVMRSRWFGTGNAAEKSTKYFSLQGAGRGEADAQQLEPKNDHPSRVVFLWHRLMAREPGFCFSKSGSWSKVKSEISID